MASLHVRNVDEALVARLKDRAAKNGRSAEAEHRVLLRQALADDGLMSFAELSALSLRLTSGHQHTPVVQLVRESRDER